MESTWGHHCIKIEPNSNPTLMKHLVKLVVYITDIKNRESVYRTIGKYTKNIHPVSTGLVVNALARPEWLVEIDATAVIPK